MRRLIVALLTVALSAVQLPIAEAAFPVTTHIVKNNPGGIIEEFILKYDAWARHGDRVKVSGYCDSSCTLMLGAISRRNICATKGATFGFHSATDVFFDRLTGKETYERYSVAGTDIMWHYYASDVRAALARRGWDHPSPHPNIIPVPATELVKTCA